MEKRAAQDATVKVQRKLKRTEKKLASAERERDADDDKENDDDDHQMQEAADAARGGEAEPVRRLDFELVPRRDEIGRFQAESPDVHAVWMAQLARGVAPSTISANVADVAALRGDEIPAPCAATLRRMRGEVTLVSEAMAAWKFAKAKRILFAGWDESTKFGDSIFAMTFLVENFDGGREEVCLRGITLLPTGGTAKALLEHIEARIFIHSRRILGLWIEVHEKANERRGQLGSGGWRVAREHPRTGE